MSWPLFPYFLTGQPGFIASPTWLAAVDGNPDLATQPVGTGPFIVQEYLPGDRMTVTKNPDYWRQDEAGNQLPYLDEIEFRVIVDSQVRAQALEAGDVDLIATSDSNVVGQLRRTTDFVMLLQKAATSRRTTSCSTSPSRSSRTARSAARWSRRSTARTSSTSSTAASATPASGPFSPGQDGYLEDTGLPEYDPEAAAAAIEDWEAANGPLTINYSTTPTGTTKAIADYLQSAWGEVGVDVTQTPIEQSVLITNALLGSPDFDAFGWRNHAGLVRRHPELLVARLRRRRLRRRGRRTARRAELRAPQRPGHQRPARPGPLGDRPRRPQGDRPGDQPAVRQGVLDPADVVDDVGHHHGPERPEHRPQPAARRRGHAPRRRRVPRPGLADVGRSSPSERAACATLGQRLVQFVLVFVVVTFTVLAVHPHREHRPRPRPRGRGRQRGPDRAGQGGLPVPRQAARSCSTATG